MEIVCEFVHPLHLLLSAHLEPGVHIDAQILELLLQAQLGPFVRIVPFWAGWMLLAILGRHSGSGPLNSLACKTRVKRITSVLSTIESAIPHKSSFIIRVHI